VSDHQPRHELTADQQGLVEMIRSGDRTRILVVAPPGTGKTYALTAAVGELLRRVPQARVLALAPAALTMQVTAMLAERLALSTRLTRLTGSSYLALRQEVGDGEWQPGVYVMSLDLAKRDDVAEALSASAWDLVVVDEAHALMGTRAELATSLANSPRVRSLVLLSALPLRHEPLGELVPAIRWKRPDGRPALRSRVVLAYHRTPGEQELYVRLRQLLDEQAIDKRLRSAIDAAWRSSVSALERVLVRERSKLKIKLKVESIHRDWPTLFDPLVLSETADGDEPEAEDAAWREPASAAAAIDELLRHISHLRVDSKLEAALIAIEERERAGDRLPSIVTAMRETAIYLSDALESRERPAARVTGERVVAPGEDLEAGGAIVVATDAGLQGIELGTDTLLSYDLPRSRLRIEQRWGRVDRVGRDEPVTMLALRDLSAVDPVEDELLAVHGFTNAHTSGAT
jgi:AAA domain